MLELGVRPHDTLAAPPSVELRPLEPDDWPAVAEIYWDGMRDGLATFATEVPSWQAWDEAHLPGQRLVAELLGEVVGWATLSPASKRRCYAGVVENRVHGMSESVDDGRLILARDHEAGPAMLFEVPRDGLDPSPLSVSGSERWPSGRRLSRRDPQPPGDRPCEALHVGRSRREAVVCHRSCH